MSKCYDYKRDEHPYVLDYIDLENGNKILALTKKNSEFIEAVLKLDSNYSKESKITPPNEKKQYVGSATHWFEQMKNGGDFATCLLEAISAIDRSNSTHLEASINGREEARRRILEKYKSVEDFKAALEKSVVDKDHIIGIITAPMLATKGKRYNLSFATKLCAYAAESLDLSIRYPKYDNVVATTLPIYAKCYIPKWEEYNYIITDSDKRRCKKDESKLLELRLEKYRQYRECLERIKESIKDDSELSLKEIDHIIWYSNKG